MSSKPKRFEISPSLSQGLSDTIKAVSNNAGQLRFEVIALSRIETDPDNPRDLIISPEEILNGVTKGAPFFEDKQKELEKLKPLAETIKKKGLINPIVVYKHAEKYRLVAGERRFLASLLIQKDDIQARILNEKPKGLELRLLQWIENTEREDLSLKDRIGNVKSILSEYCKENPAKEISTSLIKELIGVSLPQASCYMSVLNSTKDIEEQISLGNINNLDKAAFIAKIENDDLRKKAIESCINGGTLKVLRQYVDEQSKKLLRQKKQTEAIVSKKRGRVATRINLGVTKNSNIVKHIIFSVLNTSKFKHIENEFKSIKWDEYDSATKAFKKFISLLEKESI